MPIHDYQSALVTGASSGIGRACVNMLQREGMEVVALGSRAEPLEAACQDVGCEAMVLNLRDTREIYSRLAEREFDVVVNNAGLAHGTAGGFASMKPDQIDEMMEVNVTAALHVLRATVPGMITRKRGHIVEMGSIAGLYPLGMSVYGASKGAIHMLSSNLRMELNRTKIRHTEICPGRTVTGFFKKVFQDQDTRDAFVSEIRPLAPDDIADAVRFALCAPIHVNVGTIEITPVDQSPGGQVLDN